MRQIFSWLGVMLPMLVAMSCGQPENKFTIVANIDHIPPQTVFLEELNPVTEITIIDSARIDENGQFKVSGIAQEPGLYRLRFEQDQFILLSVDDGPVKIKGDWNELYKYTVSGSPASTDLKNFLTVIREHLRDFNTLSIVLDSLQANGQDSLLQIAQTDLQTRNVEFTQYIERYADTTAYLPNALFAVQMLHPSAESAYLNIFAQTITSRFPESRVAADFSARLKKLLAGSEQETFTSGISIGSTAPEISSATPNGEKINLSSFRGKYVLVDFWASWCGPCRAENPNVVAAFNQFKDQNFTILGVSLDNDKDKWMKAIIQDNLTWTHISDLQGWESVAARDYEVEAIPTNYLVNPEGIVVARDLRGPELEAKLSEIFPENQQP